jgi:hypothetical protein
MSEPIFSRKQEIILSRHQEGEDRVRIKAVSICPKRHQDPKDRVAIMVPVFLDTDIQYHGRGEPRLDFGTKNVSCCCGIKGHLRLLSLPSMT